MGKMVVDYNVNLNARVRVKLNRRGIEILQEKCDELNKLFNSSYKPNVDENGYYDGWTEHEVIIIPSLRYGFNVKVTGKNKNDIKEYIRHVFNNIV